MLNRIAKRTWGRLRYQRPANIDLVYQIIDAPTPILPGYVVIETLSYCNSTCTFCPANKIVDTRGKHVMPDAVLDKILNGLRAWSYNGVVCMHGNSEPLLNPNIAEIVGKVRAAAPGATISLWTNGTKLDWSKHEALFANGLNHMHINNYTTKGTVHKSVSAFMEQFRLSRFSNRPDILVQMFIRQLDEVLLNKAGMAPNKLADKDFVPLVANCGAPIRSMQINYKGDAFSCCFDDYYSTTFGNVLTSSLDEIWTSDAYRRFRRELADGKRRNYPGCAKCDAPHEGTREWHVKETLEGRHVHVSPGLFADSPLEREYTDGIRNLTSI